MFSDIFPNVKIAQGNASYRQWALEGQFFSYKGAGIGGSVTGRGGNILVVDDPVKNAEEAFNENALDKQWQWFTGTFLSRQEQKDHSIKIINMTRWSKKDLCGRILDGPEADEWFVLLMPVEDEEGNMLCPDLLSKKRLESFKKTMDEAVLNANYYQKPVDLKGKLYKSFKTYEELPKDADGNNLFEKIIAYVDTADTGEDYLCVPIAGVYQGELYMLDVLYTKEGMETTEPQTANILVRNGVTVAKFESNNGGRSFARNVERLIWERHNTRKVKVEWMHQSKNKQARILSNSVFVMDHIYFPTNWKAKWPEYYKAMTEYQKEGKNKHDDAPDATTGLVEMMDRKEIISVEPVTMDYGDVLDYDYSHLLG